MCYSQENSIWFTSSIPWASSEWIAIKIPVDWSNFWPWHIYPSSDADANAFFQILPSSIRKRKNLNNAGFMVLGLKLESGTPPGPQKYVVLSVVWLFYAYFSSFDHIWKIKVLGRCAVFGLLILSSILGCLLFVALLFFDRWSQCMNSKVLCPTTSRNIEIHCVSWYFMYILMYRYHLGIQLLHRRYIYIHIHSTLYLHWWFLILDCQVAFWLTS